MKNIVFFTYGDANNPSTWSNVPYLLTNAFENKGYNVIKVDMSTKRTIFVLLYNLICKIIKPSTTFYFVRSKLNRRLVNKKIKRAVKKYDEIADLYICISYDFSPSEYTEKKVLLFHDWPIEYALERRFNKKIDFLEKGDIKRHKKVIEDATYRVCLFKDVSEYMNDRFDCETHYLGGLINNFYKIDGFDLIENRRYITFIGKSSYMDSAKKIIKAFESIDKELIEKNNIELHIIGMKKNNFIDVRNNNIHFHGYLDKGDKEQMEEYYDVLKNTIVVLNTSEKWGGLSSIMESMHYYRPVITAKYEEFVKTFGEKINFGFYVKNNVDDIKNSLIKFINMDKKEYKKMAYNAHNEVQDYTYDAYVEKIINLVKKSK